MVDRKERPVQLYGSSCSDATIPDVPKNLQPAKKQAAKPAVIKTPATKDKTAGKGKRVVDGAVRLDSVYDPSLAFGANGGEYMEDQASSNSDDSGSESSVQSSDGGYEAEPQPVYSDFTVPVFNTNRKLNVEWKVVNDISSSISVVTRWHTICIRFHSFASFFVYR